VIELVRSRLTLVGPTTAKALGQSLDIEPREVDAALLALESEGVVLRGQFTPFRKSSGVREGPSPEPPTIEWCDRTLLARIHRYTLGRLRAEIEPVSPADFMRFLFTWQHVDPSSKLSGLDGLREAVALLDGFELGAAAWERAVLPARMDRYDPAMLDMLCLAGEVGWARFSPARPSGDPPRLAPATPVALFLRDHAEAWRVLGPLANDEPADVDPDQLLTGNARRILDLLRSRGASFFNDLRTMSSLDGDGTREAIGTLVAAGLAASDGFSGLRALVWAAQGRPASADRRAKFAGRWTALERTRPGDRESALETQAWTLLRRYGVVCRRLLTRENLAAPWRELARIYRRLEARGEVRGGRFVSGMSGEQFALPNAIPQLREVRRVPADGRFITISTADPLNLAGIVTAGERIRSAGRNRVVYRDGVPLAVREGDEVRGLAALDESTAAEVARALSQRQPRALSGMGSGAV
jgi:ATP-dependent Lhr-like helicase